MDPTLLNWFEDMKGTLEGRISLGNLRHDVLNERLDPTFLGEFLEKVSELWGSAAAPEKPEDVVSVVATSAPAHYLCQGPTVTPTQLSRIMAAHVLVDKNVNKANLPFAIRGEITDEQVKELQEKGFANGVAKGEVSGRHGFAWVTTTYAIEQLRASTPSDRLPSKVRNLAGLMHLDDEEHLVEIKYPLYSPVVSNLAAPTFLEGCPSRIFRCCHSSTGWGRTVDLDTLNDGLPEAVHPPVPFTEEFHLLDIGRLDASCPPYDEAAFERTLPHPWLNDSIREVAEYVR